MRHSGEMYEPYRWSKDSGSDGVGGSKGKESILVVGARLAGMSEEDGAIRGEGLALRLRGDADL